MIIGVSGKSGSGKDTYFLTIKEELEPLGFRVVNLKFAARLKQAAALILNVPVENFEDANFKNSLSLLRLDDGTRISYREALILIGKIRDTTPNVWLNSFIDDYKKYLNEFGAVKENVVIVVTDLRYKNEYQLLKDLDAKLIRINRKGLKPIHHISEMDLDFSTFHYTIQNDNSLEEFKAEVLASLNV